MSLETDTLIQCEPLNVVFVGPTNVGKSTLFNRLTKTRKAIVYDKPGVTIDWQEYTSENNPIGSPINFIDTGGVGLSARELPLGKEVEKSALTALKNADLVFFVVDGSKGVTAEEEWIADWLRKSIGKKETPVFVVANKTDRKDFDINHFYVLGFEKILAVSAEHGNGVDEIWTLLDEQRKTKKEIISETDLLESGVMIMGRPNVGKSTLMNQIIGQERSVVSPQAGTTRDSLEVRFESNSSVWRLVDTAGLRRPGRREEGVEYVSSLKVKEAARKAQLAILVLDATEGITDLDAALAGMAQDFGLSLVIALNKWDQVDASQEMEDLLWKINNTDDLKLRFLKNCPRVRISALTGKGLKDLKKTVDRVLLERQYRFQTSELNKMFEREIKGVAHPQVGTRGGVKFYYISQVGVNPPQFVLFSNISSNKIHFSFRRFVENVLRKEYPFVGTPLKIHFKKAK